MLVRSSKTKEFPANTEHRHTTNYPKKKTSITISSAMDPTKHCDFVTFHKTYLVVTDKNRGVAEAKEDVFLPRH